MLTNSGIRPTITEQCLRPFKTRLAEPHRQWKLEELMRTSVVGACTVRNGTW